jgi:hypothetical protein
MQLTAEFAKILPARSEGSRRFAHVTRNFSGDCPESGGEYHGEAQRSSPKAWCTLVAAIRMSMHSMPLAA